MSTIAPKFAQLRGNFALRNITKGELVHTPVFNATTASLTPSVNTEEIPSTGDVAGTVFSFETNRSLTLSITAQSRHAYMLQNYLLGSMEVREAATGVTFSLPAMKAGQLFPLPAVNILSVTIGALVEGVDFVIKAKSGAIEALVDIAATPSCTFDHGEYEDFGVFNDAAQHYEILFTSETTGQSYIWFDGLLVPSGDYSLLQESGIGTAQVQFKLIEKTGAVPHPTLGKYGRARNVG